MKTQTPRYLAAGLCALAFAFVTATSFADQGADDKPAKGPSKADLKKYDANADGQLDDTEAAAMKADKDAKKAAAKQARLDKYDTNKDGKISKEEKALEDADKAAMKAEKKSKDGEKKAERANEKSKSKN